MITKGDLKIEAARLAMEAVNMSIDKGVKIEFTPLAEEIYVFLGKDLKLKDVEDPKDMMSQLTSMMGGMNWNSGSFKQVEDETEKDSQTATAEA